MHLTLSNYFRVGRNAKRRKIHPGTRLVMMRSNNVLFQIRGMGAVVRGGVTKIRVANPHRRAASAVTRRHAEVAADGAYIVVALTADGRES
jgi:hypothetical protein